MSAKLREITAHQSAFCLSIMWLEAAYNDEVWVMEADEENGRLLLVGDTELCKEFQGKVMELTASISDPAEQWRYYG